MSNWWRRDSAYAAALVLVALLPRLYVALSWASEPVWDGHYYDFGAHRIAEGFGYSDDRSENGVSVWHPWCHYPVGYSAVLAMFYRLFGASHHVAGVVNASIGAALALVTWALARRAMSELRARVAGALVALHPGLILYAALVMTEPLAALLTLLAFWLAVRDRLAWRGITVGALVLGVAALVRPQALLCAPFLALVDPSLRTRLAGARWLAVAKLAGAAAIACAIALLPVLPWTARNCRVMDGCALVSTNAGWNLAIGAFPRATGRFETLRSSDGCRDVTGQVQQDRCWFDYGVREIRENPVRWLALIPAKLGFTFDHESFAVEYLREARPAAWPEDRRVLVRGMTTLVHRMLVAAAMLGCIAFRFGEGRHRSVTQGALLVLVALLGYIGFASGTPTFWPMVIFVSIVPWLPLPGRAEWPPALLLPIAMLATTVVTHAVFFGEDRYHEVVTPVLCMLAAAALRAPASKTSGNRAFAVLHHADGYNRVPVREPPSP